MAFDQFETLEEKIQYVLENHDKLMQQRIEKADKKIEKYKLDIDSMYLYGKTQDLDELRIVFSNLKHYYKYYTLDKFIKRYLNRGKKRQAEDLGLVIFTFYIAMMEEVCNRHGIECPDFITEEKNLVLPIYFADPGCYAYDKHDVITKENFVSSYEDALPIFKKHNLLIEDIDNVY